MTRTERRQGRKRRQAEIRRAYRIEHKPPPDPWFTRRGTIHVGEDRGPDGSRWARRADELEIES